MARAFCPRGVPAFYNRCRGRRPRRPAGTRASYRTALQNKICQSDTSLPAGPLLQFTRRRSPPGQSVAVIAKQVEKNQPILFNPAANLRRRGPHWRPWFVLHRESSVFHTPAGHGPPVENVQHARFQHDSLYEPPQPFCNRTASRQADHGNGYPVFGEQPGKLLHKQPHSFDFLIVVRGGVYAAAWRAVCPDDSKDFKSEPAVFQYLPHHTAGQQG